MSFREAVVPAALIAGIFAAIPTLIIAFAGSPGFGLFVGLWFFLPAFAGALIVQWPTKRLLTDRGWDSFPATLGAALVNIAVTLIVAHLIGGPLSLLAGLVLSAVAFLMAMFWSNLHERQLHA